MADRPPSPTLDKPQAREPESLHGQAADDASWINDSVSVSDGEFCASWLQRQCAALDGAESGLILLPTTTGLVPAASWPPARPIPPDLARIAERAATASRPIIAWLRRPHEKKRLDLLIGIGIRLHGSLAAVIAVAIGVEDGIERVNPDALVAQLHMGCGWLDARLSRRQAGDAAARIGSASVAMDIVAVASACRHPSQAAGAVINELAIRLRCVRVSLGLIRRGRIKLRAMSHAASFQERSSVVDTIENAMEECLAQAVPIAYPAPTAMAARIAVAHRDLVRLHPGPAAAASVVLTGPDGPTGVLTFEQTAELPFDAGTLQLAETIGALLGPVLRMQMVNDRLVSGRVVDRMQGAMTLVLGRERPSLKLAVLAAGALIAALCVAEGEYRVTARAVLEGEVQRAAVAPFDGFVAASSVRPGDHVREGDVLAAMDDHDLVLERARAWADAEKLHQKYDEAMAKHDRPNTAMLTAQIDQAEAQLALAEEKLRRSKILSPIDGLLVSGDLSQMLGSPLERGKTLFEVAPLDRYRVVLRSDERDLRALSVGQSGQLSLAGAPDERRGFTVTRITPIAEAKDGRNEFRVEAALDKIVPEDRRDAGLRPGMEGIAKISAGPHRLVWIWTHGLVDWLRQTAWKYLP